MAELSKDLRIFISHRAGETLVEIGGELDAQTADVLEDRLQMAVNESRAAVLLDMAGVTFCDSFGLRSVVRAERNLTLTGRHLRIVDPSAQVARLLELTGLRHLAEEAATRRRDDVETQPTRATSNDSAPA